MDAHLACELVQALTKSPESALPHAAAASTSTPPPNDIDTAQQAAFAQLQEHSMKFRNWDDVTRGLAFELDLERVDVGQMQAYPPFATALERTLAELAGSSRFGTDIDMEKDAAVPPADRMQFQNILDYGLYQSHVKERRTAHAILQCPVGTTGHFTELLAQRTAQDTALAYAQQREVEKRTEDESALRQAKTAALVAKTAREQAKAADAQAKAAASQEAAEERRAARSNRLNAGAADHVPAPTTHDRQGMNVQGLSTAVQGEKSPLAGVVNTFSDVLWYVYWGDGKVSRENKSSLERKLKKTADTAPISPPPHWRGAAIPVGRGVLPTCDAIIRDRKHE